MCHNKVELSWVEEKLFQDLWWVEDSIIVFVDDHYYYSYNLVIGAMLLLHKDDIVESYFDSFLVF